jgi:hypothetical protein
VLRRLAGKAPKRRNIEIFLRFGNTARQDASAHKNVKLFLREPLEHIAANGSEPAQFAGFGQDTKSTRKIQSDTKTLFSTFFE